MQLATAAKNLNETNLKAKAKTWLSPTQATHAQWLQKVQQQQQHQSHKNIYKNKYNNSHNNSYKQATTIRL